MAQVQGDAAAQVTVAILDDHRLIRDALRDLLEKAGIEVVATAGDVETFLGRIASAAPTVVLVDLMLEDSGGLNLEGGLNALRELRKYHEYTRPIVVSSVQDPAVVQQCMDEGAWAYLDKHSIDPGAVLAMVQSVARGERAVSLGDLRGRPAPTAPVEGTGNSLLNSLTMREREVLSYVAGGADNLKIASMLDITERTVKAHISALYRKLGSENRTQLALLARQLGVRPPNHT